jgi:hypothetical protein
VFPFFYETISAGYFRKLNRFLRIALSIQNAFFGPLFTETEEHVRMAEAIAEGDVETNPLQELVEEDRLATVRLPWIRADEDCCLEFPELTMDDLEAMTLGKYQLRMGAQYNIGHIETRNGYIFDIHKDMLGLIRVRMRSRFSKSQTHLLWIQFREFSNGREAVLGWYCKCQSGARTVGCCSHIAAVSLSSTILVFAC